MADAMLADALASDLDELTDMEVAQIRVGIRHGLANYEEGRAKPIAEWVSQRRREFNLPSHLADAEL